MINNQKILQLAQIHLKGFRCFDNITFNLDSPVVMIYGINGAGKTSLLEALYYGCYLRSFRTNNAKDLIAINRESFFMQLSINDMDDIPLNHTITIGFSDNKRLVKVNNKSTISYKDLLAYYRVISLTEDDLLLIKGAPEYRRAFIDQALLLNNHSFLSILREYRVIVDQRNSLLNKESVNNDEYLIWTKTLWKHTQSIQAMRLEFLKQLEEGINIMLYNIFKDDITVTLSYQAKKNSDLEFKEFLKTNSTLFQNERYFKRSLFGAHLDDFSIIFEGKKSRSFASRGQQKMLTLLIKAAQIHHNHMKGPSIFLLDDFMTDFDKEKSECMLSVLLSLKCQLIFTSPHRDNPLENALKHSGVSYRIVTI